MTAELFHARVYRLGREERDAAFVVDLDLDDVEAVRDLLARHLVGAALRARARRDEAHEFTLDLRRAHNGAPYGDVVLRWALPVDPVPGW